MSTIIGNQTAVTLAGVNALVYTPADMDPNKKYALILHIHGQGECGVGVAGLKNLTNTSLPQRIANGLKPAASDGTEFIVVSPQGQYSPPPSFVLKPFLAALLAAYPQIDTNRMIPTGYSNGGYSCWTCITDDVKFAAQFAAVVPVSAAPVEEKANVNGVTITRVTNISINVAANKTPVWNICGVDDGFIAFADAQTAAINAVTTGPKAADSRVPNDKHDTWNFVYDPAKTWAEVGNINFYDWAAKQSLTPAVVVPPVTTPPVVAAKTIKSIVITYSDGSVVTL